MLLEYYINSTDEKDEDIKLSLDKAIAYKIKNILAPINQCRFIKKNYSDINLGVLIDYPLASCDFDRRIDLIQDAISIEANYVTITLPFYYVVNRKYSKLREDIKKNLGLCRDKHIDIRYMLEYRKFDHQLLAKVCDILMENEVNIIYPSTGIFIDNIEDNVLACAYLKEKTGINTIVNGNIWKKSQIDNILKIKPYGISINQMSNIQLIG